MKIAAIVVIYNPNIDEVYNNILKYIEYIDKLIIYENSQHTINFSKKYKDKIVVFGSGTNNYIAKPLNEAINYCIVNGYDYLLTMDQDSTWENFKSFIDNVLQNENSQVVIYSPNINNMYNKTESYIDVESVITSGSLCNVQIVNKLGGFREDYKIYWVDGEFCYWARKNGYLIRALTKVHLSQKFGEAKKNIFGFCGANYSPIVYYFLFRNMLWQKREFYKSISFKCILYTFKLYGIGCLFDKEKKIEKVIKIIYGIFDGIFKRIPNRRESI